MASEASSQKIYRVGEVIADGNSDQVVADTLADLFDVKEAISKDNSARLLVSTTGEDLRFLGPRSGMEVDLGPLLQSPVLSIAPVESGTRKEKAIHLIVRKALPLSLNPI